MESKEIQANIEEQIRSMSFIHDPNLVLKSSHFSRYFGKIRSIDKSEYEKLDRDIVKQIEVKRFSETVDGKIYDVENYWSKPFAKKIKDNHDQIDEILQTLLDVNNPLLYDNIVKKVGVKINKQYNNHSIHSSNKIFQSSETYFHFFYRNYLLLAIVNQAPSDSKAGIFRDSIEKLELFGGHITGKSEAYGDLIDLKHLCNYRSLKYLRIHDAGELKSFDMISRFEHLENLIIWGARHPIMSPAGTHTGIKVSDFNLDFKILRQLKQLKHLRMLTIIRCSNNSDLHLDTKEKVQEFLSRL